MGKHYKFTQFTNQEFCDYVNNNPVFVSRIGGSDYNAIYQYQLYKNKKNSEYNFEFFNNICSNNKGYFDKETNKDIIHQNFIKYLDLMYEIYKKQKITSVMKDIYNYDTNTFFSNLEIFNKNTLYNRKLISYGFFESITPLLENFEILTKNKKVLFITPFSKSIQYQYQRKDKLLNNYVLPDFQLLTYNTPITYNNQDGNIIDVPTNNWFEQCELMANEISKIDFDIAFLSCGSYALYLGDFIAEKLGKTSFYLGGIVNIIFNIAGDRYNNCEFYRNFMNMENQIEAFENKKYLKIFSGKNIKGEEFTAYSSINNDNDCNINSKESQKEQYEELEEDEDEEDEDEEDQDEEDEDQDEEDEDNQDEEDEEDEDQDEEDQDEEIKVEKKVEEIKVEKKVEEIKVEEIIIEFKDDKNLEKIQDKYYNKILNINKNIIVVFIIPQKLIKTRVFTFFKCWRNGYCLNASNTKIPKNITKIILKKI